MTSSCRRAVPRSSADCTLTMAGAKSASSMSDALRLDVARDPTIAESVSSTGFVLDDAANDRPFGQDERELARVVLEVGVPLDVPVGEERHEPVVAGPEAQDVEGVRQRRDDLAVNVGGKVAVAFERLVGPDRDVDVGPRNGLALLGVSAPERM